MTRTVHCIKLGIKAEGLDFQSWPGELGQKIFENISKDAWQQWLNHQTMLINEYRLNPIDPKAKELIVEEMEKFLFGEGAAGPEGYVPPEEES